MKPQAYGIRTIVFILMVNMLTGCATTGKDLVRDDIVKIEQVSSKYATVTRTSAVQVGPDVVIAGEVRRWPPRRGRIPGHVNVEIIGPDGQILERIGVRHHRHSHKSRYATFSTKTKTPPPVGSTIRVTHVWGD